MMDQGVTQEGVLRRGPQEDGITEVVEIVAERAQQHLDAARFRAKFLTKEQKVMLLPSVNCDHYLEALAKAECNLWDKSLHKRNAQLPLSLAWHKFRGTY